MILFSWNGTAFLGTRFKMPLESTYNGQVLHYSIQEPEQGGRVLGASEVSLKVGQCLQLVRDDLSDTSERIMGHADGVGEFGDRANCFWKALKTGESELVIIPNDSEWDKALNIRVVVVE